MNGPFFSGIGIVRFYLYPLEDEGRALVVSSHIRAELEHYSIHMLVLRAGRIVEHRRLRGKPRKGTGRFTRRYGGFQGWG